MSVCEHVHMRAGARGGQRHWILWRWSQRLLWIEAWVQLNCQVIPPVSLRILSQVSVSFNTLMCLFSIFLGM